MFTYEQSNFPSMNKYLLKKLGSSPNVFIVDFEQILASYVKIFSSNKNLRQPKSHQADRKYLFNFNNEYFKVTPMNSF